MLIGQAGALLRKQDGLAGQRHGRAGVVISESVIVTDQKRTVKRRNQTHVEAGSDVLSAADVDLATAEQLHKVACVNGDACVLQVRPIVIGVVGSAGNRDVDDACVSLLRNGGNHDANGDN